MRSRSSAERSSASLRSVEMFSPTNSRGKKFRVILVGTGQRQMQLRKQQTSLLRAQNDRNADRKIQHFTGFIVFAHDKLTAHGKHLRCERSDAVMGT